MDRSTHACIGQACTGFSVTPCPAPQAERDEEEISEVEMILETYFMHIDNTFNKLQTLCEYIDDTEVR